MLPGRLMAGHGSLEPGIKVRVLVGQNGFGGLMEKKLRKVMVVVTELPEYDDKGNQKFAVGCEGDIERIGNIPQDDLSPAEYWGMQFFQLAHETLKRSGLIFGYRAVDDPSLN